MLPLGTPAPYFELLDVVTGRMIELNTPEMYTGTLVMFICNHCPYVKHVQPELVKLTEEYYTKNFNFYAISSNDIEEYPQDRPELMRKEALKWGYQFPYLFDETQAVAKAYDAACTPDFFLFDKHMKLMYRGQLDGSRPGNDVELNGVDLRNAMNDLINDVPVNANQMPSQGCNIKWKV